MEAGKDYCSNPEKRKKKTVIVWTRTVAVEVVRNVCIPDIF